MEDLSQEMRVKQRDRWSCKLCGKKFVELTLYQFREGNDDDCFVSLCSDCTKIVKYFPNDYALTFTKMLQRIKVVLVGDCHGRFDRLDEVLTAEEPFDFFISVGDVGTLDDVTPENIRYIDKRGGKGFFVKGNH